MVIGVEVGTGVCPVDLAFANGEGVLGPTTASDRGRAGVGLDDLVDVAVEVEVEVGEVMVPSRTCRVPPSTLI